MIKSVKMSQEESSKRTTKKQKTKTIESKRRRRLPPTRLAWPGGADVGIATDSVPGIDSFCKPKQIGNAGRKGRDTHGFANSTFRSSIGTTHPKTAVPAKRKIRNDEMWVDKYKPTNSKSLCVANKKIKEVKEWLQEQQQLSTRANGGVNPSNRMKSPNPPVGLNPYTKLLILVGSPGIGKSTMIRVLCDELNLSVLEWNDNYGEGVSSGGRGNGNLTGYQSQIAMFEEFLTSVSFQYEPISASNIQDGWTSSSASMIENQISTRSLDTDDTRSDGVRKNGSLVLIDELPNLHTEEAEKQLRDVMNRYLEKTNTPTVLIFSDVTEGKHKPEDLERLFDARILYSPFVHVLQINPVTKAKMKSNMKDIMKKEGISMSIQRSVNTYLEELHLQSGGDMRHAIMNVQFRVGAGQFAGSSSLNKVQECSQKDTKLSTFHALGKLLYAKRLAEKDVKTKQIRCGSSEGEINYHGCEWNRDRRPPLQFNPERVLEEGDIGISGAISFVQFHSPDFFSDIMELSAAFDTLSDSAFLMCRSSDLSDYAVSLCSRAVGDTNKHPAPSKFRQLTAPKMYEIMRKRRENSIKIEQVCRRLSYRDHHVSLDINTRSPAQFATQELPFIKSIIPEEVSNLADNLYSNSRYVVLDDNIQNEGNNKLSIELERQNAVLSRDDIIDSSDSECENDGAKLNAIDAGSSVHNQWTKTRTETQHADVIVIE